MPKLFGTDGIRGQANTYPITPEMALKLGKSIAYIFEAHRNDDLRVIIGKDTRLSGYMLETALTSGLVSMGMDVLLVGPIPTPAVAHLTRTMLCSAGIMITASHNPYDDNGIKIFNHRGYKLNADMIQKIEELLLGYRFPEVRVGSKDIGKAFKIEDARGRYISFAKSTVPELDLRGTRMVIDCANGSAYVVAPLIFRELGADVIVINNNPDGYNINKDCGALHPDHLGLSVAMHDADLGIAFDGDADRVVFCDHSGTTISGDRILAICALEFKRDNKLAKNTVAVTTMSNLGLYQALAENGIGVETTDVGDQFVIERMQKLMLNFGGEESGHLIFMDHTTTGDGIIAALQVLNIIKRTGQSLDALSRCIFEYPRAMLNLPISRQKPFESMPGVTDTLNQCKADLGDKGRHLVRYSGTENKVRILVEAERREDAEAWANKIAQSLTAELGA